MDHPISAEGGRPLGHPRDPLRLGIGLRRLLDHLHKPPFGVGLQDVGVASTDRLSVTMN